MRKLLTLLFTLSLLILAGAALWLNGWLNHPLQLPPEGRVYQLQRGESVGHLAWRLAADGVIEHPQLLQRYAQLSGLSAVKVGQYQLMPDLTPQTLLQKLVAGEVIQHSLTLVEGKTYRDWVAHLREQVSLESRLSGDWDSDRHLLNLDIEHPEGWFFPDTYHYTGGTDVELLRRAHRRMQQVLSEEWSARAPDLPYKSAYEALIMASIVERETGVASERGEIAGVFVRRLQKGMRLQTDPTVIYGMGQSYQGNIRSADLKRPTPYNTYVIKGLPPTPIAMPGRAAIHAALHPKAGDALYFVAKGDGSHYFSATLEEHNRAVRRYQLQRSANYRSSPAPN